MGMTSDLDSRQSVPRAGSYCNKCMGRASLAGSLLVVGN